MPDGVKPKTEAVEIQTLTAPAAPVKTNDAMIAHLSKEIETMSNNIMNSRNRISFSLWVGPFLVLASVIVGSEKGGFGLQNPGVLAWLILGIAAFLFFWLIAFIIGRIEQGAWKQCNEWRKCIIKLQMDQELKEDEYEDMVLYKKLRERVLWAYMYVFTISLLMFAAVIIFVSQLLDFSHTAVKWH
jgi:hypothetical protein